MILVGIVFVVVAAGLYIALSIGEKRVQRISHKRYNKGYKGRKGQRRTRR